MKLIKNLEIPQRQKTAQNFKETSGKIETLKIKPPKLVLIYLM